jgi:hypothetical protein
MPDANTVGCYLMKWDNTTATWIASYCFNAGGWSPNITLNPGEGAFLANPGPAFSLTFTGAAHPFAAVPSPFSGLYSSQSAAFSPATYDDIFYNGTGGPGPASNIKTANFVVANQSYLLHTYRTISSTWINGAPAASLGEAIWVNPPADAFGHQPPAPPVYLVAYLTSVANGFGLTLLWTGSGVLQQSMDLTTWTDVLDASNHPVTSPYTAPISGGYLYFRVRP